VYRVDTMPAGRTVLRSRTFVYVHNGYTCKSDIINGT
jgi:hypothetical protein